MKTPKRRKQTKRAGHKAESYLSISSLKPGDKVRLFEFDCEYVVIVKETNVEHGTIRGAYRSFSTRYEPLIRFGLFLNPRQIRRTNVEVIQ